jgi:hypothetical protein
MDSDELAREAVRMNRAIVRCLHHLAAGLPEEKQGDFLLLLNDIQSKNMKMADALRPSPMGQSDNDDREKSSA